MSDELKPGETRVYDKHGRLVSINRGLVGQGGGGGPVYFPAEIYPVAEENTEQEIKILKQQREEMKNEIIQLREKVKKLNEALKPFAAFAERWDKNPLRGIDDTLYSIHGGESCGGTELKLSDLKNARDAYNNTK